VDSLRLLKEETGAEMDALMPTVLDRAFKGELQPFFVKNKAFPALRSSCGAVGLMIRGGGEERDL